MKVYKRAHTVQKWYQRLSTIKIQ